MSSITRGKPGGGGGAANLRRRDRRTVNLNTVLTPHRRINPSLYLILGLSFFGLVLVLWLIAASAHIVDQRFLPSPTGVWQGFLEYYRSGNFWSDV